MPTIDEKRRPWDRPEMNAPTPRGTPPHNGTARYWPAWYPWLPTGALLAIASVRSLDPLPELKRLS
jgi:hypothetical protein